jgi:tetratricopeptide (TPR) repeat protein
MRLKTETQIANHKSQSSKWIFCLLTPLLCILSFRLLGAEYPAAQHYQAGLAYERLGRLDEAYTELQLAFALNQEDAPLALALGIVACRLGRWEVAKRALERSIAIDSNSVASYFQLGLLYEKNGTLDRALDAWQRFSSLSHDAGLKSLAQKHILHLEQQNQ